MKLYTKKIKDFAEQYKKHGIAIKVKKGQLRGYIKD